MLELLPIHPIPQARRPHRLFGRNRRNIRSLHLLRRRGDGRGLEELSLMVIKVLARVDRLVLNRLHQLVEANGKQRAHERPDPVDPVVSVEEVRYYGGAEAARGIEGTASKEDA
jgi:hypothetical protein